jgi:hypothetical protein
MFLFGGRNLHTFEHELADSEKQIRVTVRAPGGALHLLEVDVIPMPLYQARAVHPTRGDA